MAFKNGVARRQIIQRARTLMGGPFVQDDISDKELLEKIKQVYHKNCLKLAALKKRTGAEGRAERRHLSQMNDELKDWMASLGSSKKSDFKRFWHFMEMQIKRDIGHDAWNAYKREAQKMVNELNEKESLEYYKRNRKP